MGNEPLEWRDSDQIMSRYKRSGRHQPAASRATSRKQRQTCFSRVSNIQFRHQMVADRHTVNRGSVALRTLVVCRASVIGAQHGERVVMT